MSKHVSNLIVYVIMFYVLINFAFNIKIRGKERIYTTNTYTNEVITLTTLIKQYQFVTTNTSTLNYLHRYSGDPAKSTKHNKNMEESFVNIAESTNFSNLLRALN